jgi:hypothetical protein
MRAKQPRTCPHCRKEHTKREQYRTPAHHKRASRRRLAGVAVDAYAGPGGARRGRVPLEGATAVECEAYAVMLQEIDRAMEREAT